MRSKASIKGHAIHPALVAFPFAFLTGAFLFDIGGVLLDRESWWTTAAHLTMAGIIGALLAAVPGIIDYIYVVPPKSSAKKRGAKHALSNLTGVGLFALAYALRQPDVAPSTIVLIVEAIGVGLLGMGGYMGGTLVERNQIGVDPRYADAGKWKEEDVSGEPGEAVAVATESELKVNQMKLLRVDGKRIVLGRTEEGYVAFDDSCTHRGGSLAGGAMICGTVQCPWHGSQFDVTDGSVKAGPAKKPIETYEVKIVGKKVHLTLPKIEE